MENHEKAASLFYAGHAHLLAGEHAAAAEKFEASLALCPDRLSTMTNLSQALLGLGRIAEARALSLRVVGLDEHSADAWHNLGLIELQDERAAAAVDCFERAVALDPALAEAWLNKGLSSHALDRFDEALTAFRRAAALRPDDAEAHFHSGCALRELDRPDEALAAFQRALGIRPAYRAARYQIFSLHLAALADPDLIEQLGAELAAAGLPAALDALRATATMSDFRVLHDLEQTGYLIARGEAGAALRAANARLQAAYAGHLATHGHAAVACPIPLDAGALADIAAYREHAPLRRQPEPVQHCLNPDIDWPAVEARYFASEPEMVCIDNLLTAQALAELRAFCLGSAVWNKEYRGQYLGAFPDDGFVSRLHVRIAVELREKMPRVFGPHRLEQIWGFKYTSKMGSGINVHADFARVNLNFWITPDAANLDPESGGLVVYDAPCPPDWGFREYNQDEAAIREFLRQRGARGTRVPHRCNRAVLFNSNLFHETDRIDFREGYENRRINITYLFGKGLKTH
jgi:tetratricopeptide (TPR) repeat protein